MNVEQMDQPAPQSSSRVKPALDPSAIPYPADDLVVTRDRNGAPLSRFCELVWDRTPYATTGNVEKIYFNFWGKVVPSEADLSLAREIQWIAYLQIACRVGGSPANATLMHQVQTLRRVALYAKARNIRVRDVLCSAEHVITVFADSGKRSGVLLDIISSLRQYEPTELGFVLVRPEAIAELRAFHYKWQDEANQTPPIPSRIYSEIIASVTERVEEAMTVIKSVVAMAEEYWTNPLIGRSRERQWEIRKERGDATAKKEPDFVSLVRKYELESFWKKHGLREDGQSLSSLITAFQLIASEQIQAFSGMRIGEVRTLPFHCLKTVVRGGKNRYLILGRVTKLSNGKIKRAAWVTSRSGKDAILLMQAIAKFIYAIKKIEPGDTADRLNNNYLFVSVDFVKRKNRRNAPTMLDRDSVLDIGRPIRPAIVEADLHELEFIDPHRPWSEEAEYGLGRPWPIRTHQYRRSLALYGQRSGYVTLPSLKRQLQHITEAMTLFYGRGSAFAGDLFAEVDLTRPAFAEEWQEAKPVSEFLSYAKNVLMSDPNDLFGGHGAWVKHRLHGAESVFERSREATLQRFKNGELEFKPTVWGGCVKPGPCDKNPFDFFNLGCLSTNCMHLAGRIKKFDTLIAAQQRIVVELRSEAPTSLECRQEEHDLIAMKTARERINQMPRK